MAAGDLHSSPGNCGCVKFTASAATKTWMGELYHICRDDLVGTFDINLYFRKKRETFRWLPPDGIHPRKGGPTGDLYIETTWNVAAAANYGTSSTVTVNPGNLNFSRFQSSRMFTGTRSMMAQPGYYEFGAKFGSRWSLLLFVPGPKYHVKLIHNDPRDTINGGGDSSAANVWVSGTEGPPNGTFWVRGLEVEWYDEFTATEFNDVMRTFVTDPSLPAHRLVRDDRFPMCEVRGVSPGNFQWRNAGHAVWTVRDYTFIGSGITIDRPAHERELTRGRGIARQSRIYMPGMHSIRTHAAEQYNDYPGIGGVVEAGLNTELPFGNRYPFGLGANYFGATTACENISVPCEGGYLIPVPSTPMLREWREAEVCPP